MLQLQQASDEFERRGVQVLVVTFEKPVHARQYSADFSLRWPLLIDQDRRLYAAYGMEAGQWRKLLGPKACLTYARLLVRGRRLRRVHGDVRQLGGNVVIDAEGVVRFHHVAHSPADRPDVTELLGVIDDAS